MFFTIALIAVGLLLQLCASNRLVRHIESTYPGCLYRVETTERKVALTIDDGPDSSTTADILDLLARYDAHATFFLISSRVPGNEEMVARIAREGHEIGNHLTHDEPSIDLSRHDFEAALLEADSVLQAYANVQWFRPGSGWYNEEMLQTIGRYDYSCALGSVYPFDTAIPWVWFSEWYIMQNVEPGAVIVLHDSEDRGKRTKETLSRILPEFQSRGIAVVTLSELDN